MVSSGTEVTAVTTLAELANVINTEHRLAESAATSALEHARAAGEALEHAKSQLPHGQWLPWLESNCHCGPRMAQQYMRLAREWPKVVAGPNAQRVAHLPVRDALQLLAEPREEPEGNTCSLHLYRVQRRPTVQAPDPWKDRRARTFRDGKLLCADNVQSMREMGDASVDLCVTSAPYDQLRSYLGKHEWDFPAVAAELTRLLKPGGVIVWVVADATVNGSRTLTSHRQLIHFHDVCGLSVIDEMYYHTNKPPRGRHYQNCTENMYVLSKGKPKTFNPIMVRCEWAGCGTSPRQRSKNGELVGDTRRVIKEHKPHENVWHYETGNGKTESWGHPATFPLQLAIDQIVSWSNKHDVVLDPFAGAGTVAVACVMKERRFVGIEIEPKYCAIAENRIAYVLSSRQKRKAPTIRSKIRA